MNLVLCVTVIVLCAQGSPLCNKPGIHGQMRGIVNSETKTEYVVDFSSSAMMKGLEGNFELVHVPKNKCQKYVAP